MPKELFIYHAAAVETIPKILQEGLVADEEGYRSNMEADLEALAQRKDISLPVRRQECLFCHPSLRQAVAMTTLDMGSAGSFSELFTRSGLLIIDASSLRDQLYVADFDFFSEVIDLRHMESPDEVIQSDSYEAALTNYAQSVTAFETFDSLDELEDAFRTPEFLVETDIPPTSICETLLCKEVLGRGWFSSYPALPVGEQQ